MNKKHLFVLILILITLGVLVTVKQSRRPAELVKEEYTSLDLAFDPAQTAKITISKKDEKVEIVKNNEQWTLPDFFNARANHGKIDTFLKEIREAKGEQRANSKAVFGDFGIGDDEAIQVTLAGGTGTELLSFRIGIKKADFNFLFVRRKSGENVYLTEAALLSAIGIYGDPKTDSLKKEFWAALEFMTVDPARVLSLKISKTENGKPGDMAHLSRTGPGEVWKSMLGSSNPLALSGGFFPLNGDKVRAFFENAKAWSAQEALDPKARDYGFSSPYWVMEAGLDGGTSVKITVSRPKADAADYFAEVTGEPVVFKIPEYLIKNMEVDESRFFSEDPFGVEVDKIEKLVIRADKKEMSFQPKMKKWDALVNYLNDFKNFQVERLLFDPADVKKAVPVRVSIELQKTGEPSKILEIGEPLGVDNKEYAAQVKGTSQVFAITEGTYKQLFENLDRLKEPEPAASTAAPTSPAAKS